MPHTSFSSEIVARPCAPERSALRLRLRLLRPAHNFREISGFCPRLHYFASFCEKKWFPFIYIFTCARAVRYAVYNLKYSRETSYYLVKIAMQSICSSYLSTTSVSSRLWAKNAGSAACPLGPAHGLYSECAALSSASLLSLSYHSLPSLILLCAG